jgi:hypothetical protein
MALTTKQILRALSIHEPAPSFTHLYFEPLETHATL